MRRKSVLTMIHKCMCLIDKTPAFSFNRKVKHCDRNADGSKSIIAAPRTIVMFRLVIGVLTWCVLGFFSH